MDILEPHITALSPFEPSQLDAPAINKIKSVVESYAPISCLLSQFCVFPDIPVVYLAPYPVDPFDKLRNALLEKFSWFKPRFTEPIFHLSLVMGFELSTLPDIMKEAHRQLDPYIPLKVTLNELRLADRIDGHWHIRKRFFFNQENQSQKE